jgi:hypothetical protein
LFAPTPGSDGSGHHFFLFVLVVLCVPEEGDAGLSYERAVLEGYDAADDVLRLDYAVECRKPSPPRELLLKKLELDCVGECPPRALVGMVVHYV